MQNNEPKMQNNEPRTKEKEVRIAEIQHAAKELFCQRGYSGTSIQQIASIAGIAKGTVYLYYKGKEDLFVALILPLLNFMGSCFENLLSDIESTRFDNGDEFIRSFCDMFIDIQKWDTDAGRIFMAFQGSQFSELSEDTKEELNVIGRRNFTLLRKIVAKSVELELIRDVDPIRTADVLFSLFSGVSHVEDGKLKWTNKDHFESTMRYAFMLIFDGLRK